MMTVLKQNKLLLSSLLLALVLLTLSSCSDVIGADGNVVVSWNATGDDGSQGQASFNDPRTSMDSLTLANDWFANPQAITFTQPPLPGVIDSAFFEGLFESTVHYFAVRLADEVGFKLQPVTPAVGDTVYWQNSQIVTQVGPERFTELWLDINGKLVGRNWSPLSNVHGLEIPDDFGPDAPVIQVRLNN